MSAPHFIGKTVLDDLATLQFGGAAVLDRHGELQEALVEHCGREVASLFAEPVVTLSNGVQPTSVSWYAAHAGDPVPLASLAPEARAGLEAQLRGCLGSLKGLLNDAAIGPVLRRALHIRSTDDIQVVGGQVVLKDWALVPRGAEESATTLAAHFDRTIGPYCDFEAPRLGAATRLEPIASKPGAASAAGAGAAALGAAIAAGPARADEGAVPPPAAASRAGEAGAPGAAGGPGQGAGSPGGDLPPGGTPPPGGPPPPGAVVAAPPWYRRSWLPVLIAVVVAALVLLYLLIPGVLLYPDYDGFQRAADQDEEALAILQETNRALEDQIDQARRALEDNVCRDGSGLLLPDDMTPDPGGGPPVRADELLPPDPTGLQVPPSSLPQSKPFEGTLVELLDLATVFIIAMGAAGPSIGSGFFIAPNTILTNGHVVENAKAGEIYVTNRALGSLKPARVTAARHDQAFGAADYAVLTLEDGADVPHLSFHRDVGRLQNVVAAGFPVMVLAGDERFLKLLEGDLTAIPEMALTQGVVTVVQNRQVGKPIVAHTAAISPGNSGGPLVDSCGRVVGINTFGRVHEDKPYSVNYAIGSAQVFEFLDQAGLSYGEVTEPCRPLARAARESEPGGETPVEAPQDGGAAKP